MQKIAVIGGTGFLGQYLLPGLLCEENVHVRCLSRRKTGFEELYQNKRLRYKSCDYSEKSLLEMLSGCDALIYMGSSVPGKDLRSVDFGRDCLGEADCANTVFGVCASLGIKNITFTSSIAVYGNQGAEPYVETQKCDPNSIYGITKLTIEKLAGFYNDKYGLNIKSLRISQAFGARAENKRPFLEMLAKNCLKGEAVLIYGTGKTSQDYVYVKDVCAAIILAVKQPDVCGEFNIGIGRAVSTEELAKAYCEGFENKAGIKYLPEKREDMYYRSLNIRKAKEILGYEPKYTLTDACRDMCRIYKEKEWER